MRFKYRQAFSMDTEDDWGKLKMFKMGTELHVLCFVVFDFKEGDDA